MATRTIRVGSSSGLHARPASLFTQAVAASGIPVTIAHGEASPVDAASILMVMAQGIGQGAEVTIASEADGADAVLDQLAAMLERDLDAPDES